MEQHGGFYTMKGYAQNAGSSMTPAMEDYLEMTARLAKAGKDVKASDLARMLHVKASSVTKMVRQLCDAGLVEAQKYGRIALTDSGRDAGEYLLYRHNVVCAFLRMLNGELDELEQAEKIEHFLDRTTVDNLHTLTLRLSERAAAHE